MGREGRIFDGSRIRKLFENPQALAKAVQLAAQVYAAACKGGNAATIAAALADLASKQQALQAAHDESVKESKE